MIDSDGGTGGGPVRTADRGARACAPSRARARVRRPRRSAIGRTGIGILGFCGLLGALAQTPSAPASAPPVSLPPAQTVDHGLFSGVQVYRPSGSVQQFVELLTTGDALAADERSLVHSLLGRGAMVAVVPWGPFYKKLVAQDGKCTSGVGPFENLSHHVQAFDKLSTYLTPMLVGSGDAAAFAYALLAQAPAGTFASTLSVGFCPRLALKTPLCALNALRWQAGADGNGFDLQPAEALTAPWAATPPSTGAETAACTPSAVQAFVQHVPQGAWVGASAASAAASGAEMRSATDRAIARLARLEGKPPALGPPPTQLADLPIVEVPSTGAGTRFAVLLSGDGGWAGIDKGLGAAFAAQGIPVAGFDSLRYFWSARTPEGLASDLDRVIRYYAARWKRSEVLLIGYSQGADVLPFAINRLPAATRASVRSTVLLGPGQKASFEFHVTNWIGPSGDRPIAPEATRLTAASTLCVYGVDERDSLCPELAPLHARPMPLTGGHHFGGNYDALATKLLEAMPR